MKLSAVIPTYNRPDCVRKCLEHLAAQQPPPDQIVVVDASTDDRTKDTVAEFQGMVYLHNRAGRGNTPNSRNMGLKVCTGDIIAFLDDDAFAHPGWCKSLLDTYSDSSIGGVAGRALNRQPGEDGRGVDAIGQLRPDGTVTGNFAANPGKIVEVDHMIGCNMSLRSDIIRRLGGFMDDFRAGPFGICEETEICVRAKRLGYRLVFNPNVCVDHIGAPQPGGRRFSVKYTYYHCRNNLVMLIRNYGIGRIVGLHLAAVTTHSCIQFARRLAGACAHLGAAMGGLMTGLYYGLSLLRKSGTVVLREDAEGEEIRTMMTRNLVSRSSPPPQDS